MKSSSRPQKLVFRDEVWEFAKRRFDCTFSELNDQQRSQAMTQFFVEEILAKLQPGVIPEDLDDLEHCYVDGKNDQTVDFICRVDGYITIIQAKYRGKSKPEDKHEVESFLNAAKRLHPKLGTGYKKNAKLSEALADISWKDDTFAYYFISLGKQTDDIKALIEQGPPSYASLKELKDLDNRSEAIFLDERGLNDYLRDAISVSQKVAHEVEVRFKVTVQTTTLLTGSIQIAC